MKEYSYLKTVELGVEKLKLGMYVSKLDKPWEESRFLFQGFPIETKEQIEQLRRECTKVFVDFKKQEDYQVFLLSGGSELEVEASEKVQHHQANLAAEFPQALKVYQKALTIHTLLLQQVIQSKPLDITATKAITQECIESLKRNKEALLFLINARNRNHYDMQHTVRVSVMAIAFGMHLGMSPEQIREQGISAMLHDVGKCTIPKSILHKPDSLNRAEAMLLKDLPKESYRLLVRTKGLTDSIREVALTYHERADGRGYPGHIPPERVSRFAKIVSIIDAYDAIVSDKTYSKGRSPSYARQLISKAKNKKFDPDLTDKFLQWLGEYPLGSLVEMVTGEIGIVVSFNGNNQSAPVVKLLTDELKNIGLSMVIDLSRMKIHSKGKPYEIKSVLADHSFGFALEKHITIEMFDDRSWIKNSNSEKKSPFSHYL